MSERAVSDKPLGEREEMGLVGVLTLHMLAMQFREGFASRVRDAAAAMEGIRPSVFVDRRGKLAAGRRSA
jgi:hypothetical protein